MKAVTLYQPFASLWCSPRKEHETRVWRTLHRGWLLVHAAQHQLRDLPDELADVVEREFGLGWRAALPCGALIGAVELQDVEPARLTAVKATLDDLACGDFSDDRWAWRRGEYVVFASPIPFRGRQGIFEVPDELLRERLPFVLAKQLLRAA